MSQNQARGEKIEGQYRRTGRSTSHRGFSGGGGGRGGGGAQPPHSSNSSAGRRKSGNGQSKVTAASAGPGVSAWNHGAESSRGSSQVQASAASAAGAKPVDASGQRNARAIPKAPSSQSAGSRSSGSAMPSTPPKGDASRGTVPLQFGSISPGIVNGMQIPARTSSAPPNLDEQKRAQAHNDSFRPKTTMHTPPAPKQQQLQTGKDVSGLNQSSSGDSHSLAQTKRDVHVPVSSVPSVMPPKSTVLPIGGMPMHVPFQQPQVPMQFGGPIPQMQSQGVTSNSPQMTMALPVINGPQVPQQMFVPNIQSHPLQPQTMMHQGQSLGFAPQIGHQLPQLGNLGFGIAPQFSQPQPVKFVGPRKTTVKITHPETHEELRLDKRADSHMGSSASSRRPLPNTNAQSQPIPTFSSSLHINYYPTLQANSYNPSMFYTTSSSQLSTSSQGPRYSYSVGQNGQPISFVNPSVPISGSRPGPKPSLRGVSEAANPEAVPVSAPSAPLQVTIRPVNSVSDKAEILSVKAEIPLVGKSKSEAPIALEPETDACGFQQKKDGEIDQHPKSVEPLGNTSVTDEHSTAAPSALSAPKIPLMASVGDSRSNGTEAESFKEEPIQRSDSMMELREKTSKREHGQQYIKTDTSDATLKTIKDKSDIIAHETPDGSGKLQSLSGSASSSSAISLSSPTVEHAISAESKTSVAVDTKAVPSASSSSGVPLEKEVSEDELSGFVSLELATKSNFPEERDSLEASTSLGSKAEKTISETSDSATSLHESKSSDTEQVQENLTSTKHGIAQVSTDLLPDINHARSIPVAMTAKSVEAVNTIDLVEQEQIRFENYKETGACVSHCGEEKTETKREALQYKLEVDGRGKDTDVPSTTFSGFKDVGLSLSSSDAVEEREPPSDIVNKSEVTYNQVVDLSDISSSLTKLVPVPTSSSLEADLKLGGKVAELPCVEPASVMLSGSKDMPTSEPARIKINNAGRKKKRKEILSKADAAGTSDLYNAYKGPEENLPTVDISESVDSVALDVKHLVADDHKEDARASEIGQSKAEIDDWEDAADISTPNITLENIQQVHGNETTSKRRYTRDFLLTFSEQCADLPLGFEIGSDIADALMAVSVRASHIFVHESHPSPGRIPERSPGASRTDSRLAGLGDNDKWTKAAGSFSTGHDNGLDMIYGTANISFRPGQGINHAAVRSSRAQSSNHFSSGILPGPMQSLSSQGGIPRNNADADRWQRATNIQRGPGLIPSPHGPSQVMHKAGKKYEVGKVSDTEQAKQRQLKAILNKLTPQNFEKLFLQVNEVNIDNTITLTGVISQIFDKALMEPTFCEMYANFCVRLSNELPDFSEDNEKITFKRLLLNKCQEEFERGEREQAEANRAEGEGEIKQTEGEREEKRIKARRRMLGNIRLIGELYKKRMLTERIMHECIKKLLGDYQNPDEEDLEALCKLMSTIGEMIDHPKAKALMDVYFDRMLKLSTNQKLSSRVRFMLRDAIDLRKNNWQQRRKVEGPKKIDEVHRDAAQERQAQAGRLARGPVITSGQRRGPHIDYSPRGSALLSSPNSHQIGSARGLPVQFRGYANQDARVDGRSHFENRLLSVPLPQRTIDDNSITLGPQGGLGRGMSIRGQPAMSTVPTTDDPRRMALGPNGYSLNSRQDSIPRYIQDKFSGSPYDQRSPQERTTLFGSRDTCIADRMIDRSTVISPPGRAHGSSSGTVDVPSEPRTLSEDTLRDKSKSTIREFYSAKDEEEVALCIKELNSPSFYPSMISLWVTDSFERKEMERDLLARLLINLCTCQDSLFSQTQLIQGFESVLTSLEDAVNDAPKAAEFLGHLFAKVILEHIVPMGEIGRIVYEGGEEPGSLVDSGLASEVLGSILEFIRTEKGDSTAREIRKSSNLWLEDFLPPNPIKTNKLDAFL